MSNLNKKLQLNKENIASLNNMEHIYGGGVPGQQPSVQTVCCPAEPKEKCTHSVCSCC